LPLGGREDTTRQLHDETVVQLWEVASSRMENVRHNKDEVASVGQAPDGPGSSSKLLGIGQRAQWCGRGGSVECRTGVPLTATDVLVPACYGVNTPPAGYQGTSASDPTCVRFVAAPTLPVLLAFTPSLIIKASIMTFATT